jgi:antitoxin CcdA
MRAFYAYHFCAEAIMNTVPKKATNLSLRVDLLEEARKYGINLSQTLESALEAEVKRAKEKAWLEENRAAIEAYQRHIERDGLWSDGMRLF